MHMCLCFLAVARVVPLEQLLKQPEDSLDHVMVDMKV